MDIEEENICALRQQFKETGIVQLRNVLPKASALKLAKTFIDSSEGANVYVPEKGRTAHSELNAGQGDNKHVAFDRFLTDKIAPELGAIYRSKAPLLSSIVGNEVLTSPYERSAYYIKLYNPPDSQQGWHFDTNSLTVVFYLTDNPDDGFTEIVNKNDETILIPPEAGTILLFDGHSLLHRSQAVCSTHKVTCIMDYFYPGHGDRKPYLNSLIFGD